VCVWGGGHAWRKKVMGFCCSCWGLPMLQYMMRSKSRPAHARVSRRGMEAHTVPSGQKAAQSHVMRTLRAHPKDETPHEKLGLFFRT
jgi:hypothetical protein